LKANGKTATLALVILTALNFVNYIDRSVLFAVQPLIQREFHRPDAAFGLLTSAFFIFYMCTAPLIGPLADRYPRRLIMIVGAIVWSAATLLTAVTYDFRTLLIRHTIVGVGEATFVTIAPAYIADFFGEQHRGRVLSIFYLAIPCGSAMGYLLGGYLGSQYGWRTPFYVGAIPGFLLALALFALPEPKRGAADHIAGSVERSSIAGLFHNKAFWTCSLGMAMLTFAIGGMQVWMPTFLSRMRGIPLADANRSFGLMTLASGILATLAGGWLGDLLLRFTRGGYYLVSAIGAVVTLPAILLAVSLTGPGMYPAIFVAEFFLLINTAPLNAALVNSVSASIRATAIAVNLFTIHLLGDAFSPTLMGYISDRSNLRTAFLVVSVAVGISAVILFCGMRFAPDLAEKVDHPG
jgi:MFS transporter, Spinster family, sphingosine-1-phosphate transporter